MATVAALTAGALLYHPPVVLVAAGEPIDITADITVSGVPVHPTSGRYVITWVRVERPTVFDLGRRLLRGHTRVEWQHRVDPGLLAAGRQAFLDSQQHAVLAAARAAGLTPADTDDRADAARLPFTVEFRARDLTGPSAGLVYALVLLDLLEPGDLAGGRTVAATGTIAPDGEVGEVGGLSWKAEGAARLDAAVFLVPRRQASAVGDRGRGVASLGDAVAMLSTP